MISRRDLIIITKKGTTGETVNKSLQFMKGSISGPNDLGTTKNKDLLFPLLYANPYPVIPSCQYFCERSLLGC